MKYLVWFVVGLSLVGCSLDAQLMGGGSHSSLPSNNNIEKASAPTYCVNGDYASPVDVGDGWSFLYGHFTQIGNCGFGIYGSNLNESKALVNVSGGELTRTVSDKDGGFYISGSFTEVGGVGRAGLARINSDESLNKDFVAFGNLPHGVSATDEVFMAVGAGKVFVSGRFTSISNPNGAVVDTTTGLAKWSASDIRFTDGVEASVSDGQGGLYVGLSNSEYKGAYVGEVIHLHANGELDTSFNAQIFGNVKVLEFDSSTNTLYVGGSNLNSPTLASTPVVALRGDTGAIVSSWTPSITPAYTAVTDIVVTSTKVFVSRINSYNSALPSLFALDKTSGALLWQKSASSISGFTGLAYDGSKLYAVGGFFKVNGVNRSTLAIFDENGNMLANPTATPTSEISSVLYADGYLYIGGWFTNIGGTPYHGLARYHTSDLTLDTWNPNPTQTADFNTIRGMVYDGAGTLYVNGDFSIIGGKHASGVAAVSTTGAGAVKDFNVNAAGGDGVSTVALGAGGLFVGGTFQSIGAPVISDFAVLDAETGDAEIFDAQVQGGDVLGMTVSQDGQTLYLSGDFDYILGQRRNGLAALNIANLSLKSWAPITTAGTFDKVKFVQEFNNTVYIHGFFTQPVGINLQTREYFAAIDQSGNVLPWQPTITDINDVFDFQINEGVLYIVGRFNDVQNPNVAAYDLKSGGSLMVTGQGFDGDRPDALVVRNGQVYVADGLDLIRLRTDLSESSISTLVRSYSTPIKGLALSDDEIFVGAADLGGPARYGAVLVNLNEAEILDWIPSPNMTQELQSVAVVRKVGDLLYIAGEGPDENWNPIGKLIVADLNSSTYQVHATDGPIKTMEVVGDVVFLSGGFGNIDGNARTGLASFKAGSLTTWQPSLDGSAMFMKAYQGVLYMGGEFTSANGEARTGLAAFDMATGNILPWNPLSTAGYDFAAGVRVQTLGDKLYIQYGYMLNDDYGQGVATVDASNSWGSWQPPADFDQQSSWFIKDGKIYYFSTDVGEIVVADAVTLQPVAVSWELPAWELSIDDQGTGLFWGNLNSRVPVDEVTGKPKISLQKLEGGIPE
ncbi:hypothetical protein AZI87_16010 [Bdellovibrio bacteriovorus]|uniref:Uncharacterized protein n=1 Tax=Bdellovibrio bacteriovorus TaxID=959 RepID=A0A162FYG1_BDEBC|nr:hypothetical protein [Bdellovibrio bacteriovorus]KYG62779.1 hypothetical protein AZI87_16010 [Bdellovibrio bacteriovorus]